MKRRKAASKSEGDTYLLPDPDNPNQRIRIRMDTLWWLLQKGIIEWHEYGAGRDLQGNYLIMQIQPPKCLMMGVGLGFSNSFSNRARGDRQYPSEHQFRGLKWMAKVRGRMSYASYRLLERMFCEYNGDDGKPDRTFQSLMWKHTAEIKVAFKELAWAGGYTTENPNDDQLRRGRIVFSREPTGLHAGGMREEGERSYAPVLREKADVQSRDRAAA